MAAPSLCAPPRLYNQIAVQIADQRKLGIVDLAASVGVDKHGNGRRRHVSVGIEIFL